MRYDNLISLELPPFLGDVPRGGLPPNMDLSIGSLLGNVGIPFGGFVGGFLDGFVPTESAPEKFAKEASDWTAKALAEIPKMYADNPSKMLSELDYHLSWIYAAYVTWVKTSRGGTSGNTYKGHVIGRDYALSVLNDFRKSVTALKKDYNIVTKNIPSSKLPDSLTLFPNPYEMRADIVGGYRQYVATPKGSQTATNTVIVDGVPVEVPNKKKGFNPLYLLVVPFVLVGVWVYKKLKK